MTIHTISALVSAGRHPVSGEPRHCHNDSLALNVALQIAQETASTCQVLHAGDPNNPALQDYLALGAAKIDVIATSASHQVLTNLVDALASSDLILTGTRSESGQASGMLPYSLAEKLGLPIVNNALSVSVQGERVEVLQYLPKGKRRRVSVALPAVVSLHPLASVDLRYVYARKVHGSIMPLSKTVTNTQIPAPTAWSLETAKRKPIKLKARENKTGHARMLSAIESESKQGTVVNEGTYVEKAQVVLNYLREHKLISF